MNLPSPTRHSICRTVLGSPCSSRAKLRIPFPAGQQDKAVAEHLEKAAKEDMERYMKGGDEDEAMLTKLRAELHAEKHEVEMAPAVEGTMT